MDDKEYFIILDNIKNEITVARNKAVISANKHMIRAYYNVGKN